MGVTIGRIAVADAGIRSRVEAAVRDVGAGTPREWLVSLSATASEPAWELIVEGPRRRRPSDAEWSVGALPGGGARYRRVLRGRSERTPDVVSGALRRLMWEEIQFRPHTVADPSVAQSFEHAVWSVLKSRSLPPRCVRFSPWKLDDGSLQYVCKVEMDPRFCLGELPWRWWSPLVDTPQQLAACLEDALAARAVQASPRPARTRAAAEQGAHAPA
jgi:hypothetical protein